MPRLSPEEILKKQFSYKSKAFISESLILK